MINDNAGLVGGFGLIIAIGAICYYLEKQQGATAPVVANTSQQTTGVPTAYNMPNYLGYNQVPWGEVPSGYYAGPMPTLGVVPGTASSGGGCSGCGGQSAAPAAQNPVL